VTQDQSDILFDDEAVFVEVIARSDQIALRTYMSNVSLSLVSKFE